MTVCLLLASGLSVAGCYSYTPASSQPTLAETPTQGAVLGRPSLGTPNWIPGHTTVIVPFSIDNQKGWFDDRDPFTRGGYGTRDDSRGGGSAWDVPSPIGADVRWHNAVVRDMSAGDEWPILRQRGVISRWRMFFEPLAPDARELVSSAIVFIATVEDSNGDGLLNDQDASIAIVTDGNGRNPRSITPAKAQVWSVGHDSRRGLLWFQVVADTNGDGAFTPDDSPRPYIAEARSSDPARPLVSEAATGVLNSYVR